MPRRLSDNTSLRALLLVLCLLSAAVQGAPQFPALSGRVVDAAGVLSATTKRELEDLLAQHERETSNQLVVVTLEDLQGYAIDDYGYQLGRHWQIGQAGRDNGALLIVAPKERKVRIEVGYGLEGALTDAISHNIIQTVMLPRFRQGDYDAGVRAGVDAILAAIAGTYKPLPEKRSTKHRGGDFLTFVILAIALGEFFTGVFRSRLVAAGVLGTGTGLLVWLLMGSLVFGLLAALLVILFHIFFMGGGGGFSGGGGGFGGGGASGGW